MRYLVTGAAGLIGSRVSAMLTDAGHDVVMWDRRHLSTPIRDQRRLPKALDGIFHLGAIARSAWPTTADVWDDNVAATAHLLDLRDGEPFVFASSSAVVAPHASAYAYSKLVAESLVRDAGGIALRYVNVYGPFQRSDGYAPNVLASMALSRRQHGYVTVDGDGSNVREFLHVDDAAAATIHALTVAPGTYDVRSPWAMSVMDVARRFRCLVKHGPGRGDLYELPAKATPLPGWSPTIDPDEGMRYLEAP